MTLLWKPTPRFRLAAMLTLVITLFGSLPPEFPAAALGFISSAAAAEGGEDAVRKTLQEAKDRFIEGRYQESLGLLQTLERQTEDRQLLIEIHLYEGFAYVNLGDKARAQREFHEVLDRDPGYRLDPVLIPPQLVQAFEEARQLLPSPEELITVVSYREPRIAYAPEEEMPEGFAPLPWYKKWWVWAIAGVAVAGAVAAASGGGGGAGYTPPTVVTSLDGAAPYCAASQVGMRAQIDNGEPPFTINWILTNIPENRTETETESNVTGRTLQHAFVPRLTNPLPGVCRTFSFNVEVLDKRQNDKKQVIGSQEALVCVCQ